MVDVKPDVTVKLTRTEAMQMVRALDRMGANRTISDHCFGRDGSLADPDRLIAVGAKYRQALEERV